MKKFLLLLVGILIALPSIAREFTYEHAGNTITYRVLDEDAKTCETYSSSYQLAGELTIPDFANDGSNDFRVIQISNYCFSGPGLTAVNFPNSLLNIGEHAFSSCSGLTEIILPNSLQTIGNWAFYSCTNLTTVVIPSSVRSIGKDAFGYCSPLKTAYPNNLNNPFQGSFSVAYPSEGAIFEDGFIYGPDKTVLYFAPISLEGEFNVPSSVLTIGNFAFRSCSQLTVVNFPNSLQTIGDAAFFDCSGLTTINFGDSLESIGTSAFYSCSGLTEINLPNSLQTIGDQAFMSCSGLTEINLPNSLQTIGAEAFWSCSKLTTINFGDSIKSIGKAAFKSCSKLTAINFPNSLQTIGGEAFKSCQELNTINFGDSIKSIGKAAFESCSKLTAINFPNSLQSIGAEAFKSCEELNTINFGDSIKSIGKAAFESCSKLTVIDLPNSLQAINNSTFSHCSGLTTINFGNSIESIGSSAFNSCSGLTEINLPNSLQTISTYAFASCTKLTSVVIPSSVNKMYYTSFDDCSSLIKSAYPDLFTSNPFSEGVAVAYPRAGAIVEDGFVYGPDKSAIYFAPISLEDEFIVPSSVKTIGKYAFSLCSKLTSIVLPQALKTVGEEAFYKCDKLNLVKALRSYPAVLSATTFDYRTYVNATLEIPENSLVAYMTSNEWMSFRNISVNGYFPKNFADGVYNYKLIDNPENREAVLVSPVKSLTNADIPERFTDDSDPSNPVRYFITAIGPNAFSNCSNDLKSVAFNSRSRVHTIGEKAFANCSQLTSITLPESVSFIGRSAFSNCINLQYAEFASTEALCKIKFESNPIGNAQHIRIAGKEVTEVVIPNGITELYNTFCGATFLTSITFPNSLHTIGDNTFNGCYGLTTITLPDSLETIGSYAFLGCKNLASVALPNSLKNIGVSAFSNCGLNSTLRIPSSVDYIGDWAFADAQLDSVVFVDNKNPIALGDSPFIHGKIKYLYIGRSFNPDEFTELDIRTLQIGDMLTEFTAPDFKNNEYITTLIIGNGVRTLEAEVFSGCKFLKKLTLGNSLAEIGQGAFRGCSALKEVILPPSVETIEQDAFNGATQLSSIIMGHNVKSIGDNAFNGCPAKTVSITAQTPPSAPNTAFSNYAGQLWLQDPGDQSVMNAYYDAFTCWDRFNSFAMVTPAKLEGDVQEIQGVAGEQFQLTAKLWPDNVTLPEIFWRSTNPDIATVDLNGVVTLHADVSDAISRARSNSEEIGRCKIIAETLYANGPMLEFDVINNSFSSIDAIVADIPSSDKIDYNAPYEVYNLNGMYVGNDVDNLSNGFYIVRQRGVADKISVR